MQKSQPETQPHPEYAFDIQRQNMLPTEEFPYDDLDSIEDRFREALTLPNGVAELIRELSNDAATERAADAVAQVIVLISEAREPRLAVAALALAAGLNSDGGASGADLAEKFGCSKQNVSQQALKYARLLGLKPARGMRPLAARKAMAESYRLRHGVKPAKPALAK